MSQKKTKPQRKETEITGPLRVGEWLLTTRESYEGDLVEELVARKKKARVVAPALVAANGVGDLPHELMFARQGFETSLIGSPTEVEPLVGMIPADVKPFALHVWTPDSDRTKDLTPVRDRLEAFLQKALESKGLVTDTHIRKHGGYIVQVAVGKPDWCAAGITPAGHAISLAPGGRSRMRLPGDRPSRSARKLEEAFAWLGIEPGAGDSCVDLGAAPGGWTYVLLRRRARVVAVDLGRLDPELMSNRSLTYVRANAFQFEPDEPVDWLVADLAYRPLEVAAMLAKWARRNWAGMLVANIKLPMKTKVDLLARVFDVLQNGGWRDVRARHLYHDRDEITLFARNT